MDEEDDRLKDACAEYKAGWPTSSHGGPMSPRDFAVKQIWICLELTSNYSNSSFQNLFFMFSTGL